MLLVGVAGAQVENTFKHVGEGTVCADGATRAEGVEGDDHGVYGRSHPGCVTVVKLGPEGVDGGEFLAQSVRAATVFEKYWPWSELAFADSGCGGGTPLPMLGAGELVRVLEVHVPGKVVDGVEKFTGKWWTTPTVRYTSEPEGPSQPGNMHKPSLERIFDKLMLDSVIDRLKEEAEGQGKGER